MFGQNWSIEQIENELALKFNGLIKNDQHDQPLNDQSGLSGEAGVRLDAVLSKISEALEDQSLFRSEIRSLRDEVAELRKDYRAMEKQYGGRVKSLEDSVDELKESNTRLEQLVRSRSQKSGRITFPSNAYLGRPLVIRSAGEYLGVQGGGKKHFSLKDFVTLIESRAVAGRTIDTSWQKKGGNWVFMVKLNDAGKQQDVVLVTRETVTPNGNTVAEILRLNIDGRDAPDSLLLSLFRQVRATFGEG